ncbi:hypothetical protein WJX74_002308 [Apatococcus lobatus]|uniref:FACT complex subunit SSRP1 n=1 Tax=Apatococcus lobatus TaxID=904363 RepID=A0AAW1RJ45_9CHLO
MDRLRQAVDTKEGGKHLLQQLGDLDVPSAQKTKLADSIFQVLDSKSIAGDGNATPSASAGLQNALPVMQSITCISPRGKHDLYLSGEMLRFANTKSSLELKISDLEAVAVLDNMPRDKKGRVLLVLHLRRGVTAAYNKQKIVDIVFQVSSSDQLEIQHPKTTAKLKGPAVVVLCQLLGAFGVQPGAFIAPSQSIFRSAAGHNAIETVVKVNQGLLFPLPQHLLFLERPQIFIALADIRAVDFARAGGMSQTFDIHVHLKEGGLQEFSQIPQNEAFGLQQYMTNQGVALGGADEQPASAKAQPGPMDVSGSDSEEDSDFDPDKSSGSQPAASAEDNSKDDEAGSPDAQSSSEDDEDDSEEDVELFSDDDVPASKKDIRFVLGPGHWESRGRCLRPGRPPFLNFGGNRRPQIKVLSLWGIFQPYGVSQAHLQEPD